MNTGERIKQRRKELGYSVEQLAAILGKNRATIYRYESGEIKDMPTTVLEPLAKVLKTTPAALMGWGSDAERFAETAEAFNKANPHLPTLQEKAHMAKYRKLNDENKTKVDNYTDQVLRLQEAEDEVLLQAAHREMEFNEEAHDHDMGIIKDL